MRALGAVLVLLCLGGAPAHGGEALRLGVYLPNVPAETPDERQRVAAELAGTLSRRVGSPVHGRAYVNLVDLEQDLDSTALVLVESPFVADRKLEPLAVAVLHDETSTRYALYGVPAAGPRAVRVAQARMGKLGAAILEALLLEGDPAGPRLVRTEAADVLSAAALVKLGRATAVLGLDSHQDALLGRLPGARSLVRSARVPGPTLARGGGALTAGVRGEVARGGFALAGIGASDFRPAVVAEFQALARALLVRRRVPAFPEPPLRWRPAPGRLAGQPLPRAPLELGSPRAAPPLLERGPPQREGVVGR